MTRDEMQAYASDYALAHKKCQLLFPPGYGKTKTVIMFIEKLMKKVEGRRQRILIVCHSVISKTETWPAEFTKWGMENMVIGGQITFSTYQGLSKLLLDQFDAIIMDEVHYITESSFKAMKHINPEYLVVLTGTEPEDDLKLYMIDSLTFSRKIKVELDKAIEGGVMNDYIIKIFEYEIQGEEMESYIETCKYIATMQARGNAKGEQFARLNRMHYLHRLKSKEIAIRHLMTQAGDQRTLIFVASIDMANSLSEYVYHSKSTDENFKRFCNEEINHLVTLKQIREGANVPNLGLAIMGQVNSKKLVLVQQLGRLLRQDKDKIAEMWIVCASNTMDATWIRKATSELGKHKIIRIPLNL